MITPFVPTPNVNFQFEPTLGGEAYTVIITWSLFGKRWYINIYTLSGTLVLSEALIGSDEGKAIQSVTWNAGIATVTTTVPHNYKILETIEINIRGCVPEEYNGTFRAFVINNTQFQYDLNLFPGAISVLGLVFYDINIIKNYIEGSTLVFREAAQQFEVFP